MGELAASGDVSPAGMRRAIVYGSVIASFTVEDFSLERLRTLTRDDIERRYRQFVSLTELRRAPEHADLSVVVPVYNEAPNAEALHRASSRGDGRPADGHVPRSCSSTTAAATTPSRAWSTPPATTRAFRLVRLTRNFGQTAALAAGLDHAAGEIIVTMDGDLQNDPADIPRLLAKLDAGLRRRDRLAPRPPGPVPRRAACRR